MTKLNFKEVETFLNANPDFLGTFLAKNDLTKSQNFAPAPPSLSMSRCVEKLVSQQRIQRKKIIDATMDENQRFSEFVKDIAGELNVDALSHKILQNVIYLTESDRGRLFLVEGAEEKFLVSKLFDVTATSILHETIHSEDKAIRIPFGKGIVGTVAESKISMNIKNAQEDPRFDKEVDKLAGYQTRCVLCMPIMNKDGEVLGVAEILNKVAHDSFSEQDEVLFSEYLNFCGIGINNARMFQMSIEEIHRNQLLLNLAWQISVGQNNIDQVIKVILEHALKIIRCRFVSIFLLNEKGGSFSKIYRLNDTASEVIITKDGTKNAYSDFAKLSLESNKKLYEVDLNADPNYVAEEVFPAKENTEENAEKKPEENAEENQKENTYEKDAGSVLYTPIHDPSESCLGCIMFAGKAKPIQNKSDANSVEAFAVYCGLGIYNCQLYQTTVKSLTIKQVLMEILSYHMTSEKTEVAQYIKIELPSAKECKIYDFSFNDFVLSETSTVQACALMFIKMNALNILGISMEHLYHWILTVKKNYKPLLYHNWRHALNVSQTIFCALSKGGLKRFFSPFESICLLVACLCHDLDYQGCTSAKNLQPISILATVYSTSSVDQLLGRCIMILNAEATNIFQNLTAENYRHAMEFIKKAIFATDIYVFLERLDHFEELKSKNVPFHNENDKDLLTILAMVSCDLVAFSKPWNHHKILVLSGASDLFETKETVINAPFLSNDDYQNIPSMMISFIDKICLKVFETITTFDETFSQLRTACLENRKNWNYMAQKIDQFDLKVEVDKSRAGLVDFDESFTLSEVRNTTEEAKQNETNNNIQNSRPQAKENLVSADGKTKMAEEIKRQDVIDTKREKEQEQLQKEKEAKEKEEREKKEKEKKEKEEKERKEKEEKEKKEKEEKEKQRLEQEEKAKKEKEEKEKKEKEEKERKEKEEKEKKEKEEKEKKEKEEKEKKEKEEKEKTEKEEKEQQRLEQEEKQKLEQEEKAKKEKLEKEKKEKEEHEMREKEEKEKKEKEEKEAKEKEEKEKKEKEAKEKERLEAERIEKEKKEKEKLELEKKKKEEEERLQKEKKEKEEQEEKDEEEQSETEEAKNTVEDLKEKTAEPPLSKEAQMKKDLEMKKRLSMQRKMAKTEEEEREAEIAKESVKEQLIARMSDKLINLKSPGGVISPSEDSPSLASLSPINSPEIETPVLTKKLSYRQPDEGESLATHPNNRNMTRRKSCIDELAEDNLRAKTDKKGRRLSANAVSPVNEIPPAITSAPSKRRSSNADNEPSHKRPAIVRSESARQRIKATVSNTGEKRKCTPKAVEKDTRKKVQQSSFCSIL